MTKLTEAQFSMQCAFIAKNAAAWAGDILTLPERCNEPAEAKTVARFTSDMRGRLDRLDEWAGVAALTLKDDPGNGDGEAERVASSIVDKVRERVQRPNMDEALNEIDRLCALAGGEDLGFDQTDADTVLEYFCALLDRIEGLERLLEVQKCAALRKGDR